MSSVYDNEYAVENYLMTHGLADEKGKLLTKFVEFREKVVKNIAGSIWKDFKSTKKSPQDKLHIMDIGVGSGEFLFISFIEELVKQKENDQSIECCCIDNSEKQLEKFGENIEAISDDNLTIALRKEDIEKKWLKNELVKKKYDVIILIATLHHLINWRLILAFIADQLLVKRGALIFCVRTGCGAALDGNFYTNPISESEWEKVWLYYYQCRKEIGKPWEQEISISDYNAVFCSLIQNGFEIEYRKEGCWPINYKSEELISWLKEPVFSNFQHALTSEEIKKLADKFKNEFLTNETTFSVNDGWEIVMLRRVS